MSYTGLHRQNTVRFLMAASEEYVNTYSTRRPTAPLLRIVSARVHPTADASSPLGLTRVLYRQET